MQLDNLVELHFDILEGRIEIKRLHANLVPAHSVNAIWLYFLVGLRVQQHPRHLVGHVGACEFRLLIFHIGENLV